MAKIAIVTDTNAGFTVEEAKENHIFLVPMPFMIDGETYYENVDLTQEEFYERLKSDADMVTSQPSPADIMDTWEEVLKEYDQILHFTLSSGLSGAFQSANMLAEDYEGKVYAVNNHRVSVTQKQSIMDAKLLIEKGYDAKQIKEILEEQGPESSIYIMVDTLKYLKKGGRITAAGAALGTLLRIKPVLQIQGEKLDAFAKARTVSQAKSIMINAVKADMENRFGGATPDNCVIHMAYTDNKEEIMKFKADLEAAIPGFEVEFVDPLSLVVSCHIGEGAIACAVCKKVK